jgi:arginine:pyruvate transaminase
MPHPSARISGIVPHGKDGWQVHFAGWSRKQAGEDIVMLSVGDHDFDTPSETVEACVAAVRAGHHHYTQLPGIPALREAMAKVATRATGVATTAAQVMATPGGQTALYAAVQGVLDPGDHAVVVAPYYATYPGTFRAAGADFTVIEAAAEDGFQPRAEAIEKALTPKTKAILLNTPNNPTGAVYSRAALEAIAELCRRHDLWLLSDEVYWTLGGGEHISPRALDGMAERTLVINSLSKSHGMTGWRIGWLTGPADFISVLISLTLVSTYGLNDFVSHAATAALENDHGVEEIAALYAKRRMVFLDAIRGINNITVRGSEGGMYVMLDIRAIDADCERFAWGLLDAEKVTVMPGSSFGDAAAGHIRISLCQPDDILKDAANRIRRYAASYGSKAA